MFLKLLFHFNPQGKTATFKVQVVKNEGGVFNEVVKINIARKTEKFDVPSQDGFEAAEIIHDFRKVTPAACRQTPHVPILDVSTHLPINRCPDFVWLESLPGKVQESQNDMFSPVIRLLHHFTIISLQFHAIQNDFLSQV